jgi:hypothetical protein
MIHATYLPCPSIEIVGWKGRAITPPGKVMEMAEFAVFRDRIVQILEQVRATSSGRLLFSSILVTGKKIRIHSAENAEDNAAKMDPNVVSNGAAASIKSFRPAHHNVDLAVKGSEKAWRGQVPGDDRSVQKAAIKAQMASLGLPTKKADTVGFLGAVLNRAHLGMALNPEVTRNKFRHPHAELPVRLGISANAFDNMAAGLEYMPDDVYDPLCFLLYDYMLPGSGTDAQVRIMTEDMFQHDFASELKAESKLLRKSSDTSIRLQAAIMAHELIHAWRMTAGRRVVAGGWEEEAMTSGIGPFSNWRMTENSFRADLGLKHRKSYANPRHSSELMQTLSTQTSAKSYKGILF